MDLTAENLGVRRGEDFIFMNISFKLSDGEALVLTGRNGSGKSTLLKILARIQEPTAGRVSFEGKALAAWGNREFARKLAYLPQYTPAASGMLAKELVALGRYPWHGALGQFTKADQEKVDEAIELTDTVAFRDRLVDTLSGGERQRVWLAMLVAQNAESLLLDEPISALDLAHQIEVLSLVQRLSREKGLGVIVVLHDLNLAATFADDVIMLKAGQVLASGPVADTVTPENVAEIFDLEADIFSRKGRLICVPRLERQEQAIPA